MRKLFLLMLFMSTVNMFGYSISNNGKQFIKDQEKCVLTAYWDSDGYSIGYGHHSSDVTKGMTITQAQANNYFNEDIKIIEKAANRLINNLPYTYSFSQNFFDGLCSLVYNCGEGGVQNSVFYKRLKNCRVKNGKMNQDDFNYTVAGVKTSRISCKGHISRRYEEHKLMLN
ncbi:lysozyme [bacterium]|nr:lysozyme [bacterium]